MLLIPSGTSRFAERIRRSPSLRLKATSTVRVHVFKVVVSLREPSRVNNTRCRQVCETKSARKVEPCVSFYGYLGTGKTGEDAATVPEWNSAMGVAANDSNKKHTVTDDDDARARSSQAQSSPLTEPNGCDATRTVRLRTHTTTNTVQYGTGNHGRGIMSCLLSVPAGRSSVAVVGDLAE